MEISVAKVSGRSGDPGHCELCLSLDLKITCIYKQSIGMAGQMRWPSVRTRVLLWKWPTNDPWSNDTTSNPPHPYENTQHVTCMSVTETGYCNQGTCPLLYMYTTDCYLFKRSLPDAGPLYWNIAYGDNQIQINTFMLGESRLIS